MTFALAMWCSSEATTGLCSTASWAVPLRDGCLPKEMPLSPPTLHGPPRHCWERRWGGSTGAESSPSPTLPFAPLSARGSAGPVGSSASSDGCLPPSCWLSYYQPWPRPLLPWSPSPPFLRAGPYACSGRRPARWTCWASRPGAPNRKEGVEPLYPTLSRPWGTLLARPTDSPIPTWCQGGPTSTGWRLWR